MWKLLASLLDRARMVLARRRKTLSRWQRSPAGRLIAAFLAAQAAAVHAQVVPDGQTATTVNRSGSITQVTTGTVVGSTGFNSFSQFGVGRQTTVNLFLPGQAANLINIVRDERSVIDGTVNSIRNGVIGGNVFFLNPYGFMVGAGGRFNVGSLSLQTPTPAFVNGFFSAPGTPDAQRTAQALAGTAPVDPDATIDMRGTIHATGDVRLSAGALRVGGQIYSGARFVVRAPDFSEVVNARGLASSTGLEVRGGQVFLTSAGDLAVSGTVSTPGTTGEAGGGIVLRAGRDIDVQAGAMLAARGDGERSDGGTVDVLAQRFATFSGGTIDAGAGDSGNGGAIEFSAHDTVNLAGGLFTAGARQGRAGRLLIDPMNITASALYTNAIDATLIASDSIVVGDDVILSSRQVADGNTPASSALASTPSIGDSYPLTLKAPVIHIGNRVQIVTFATDGHRAGDITLDATGDATKATTAITVGSATLDASARPAADGTPGTAGNITLKALSDATASGILGYRQGSASVTLDGATLIGGSIDIAAKTVLDNDWQNGQAGLTAAGASNALLGSLSDQGTDILGALAGASIVHSQAVATSTVAVNANTTLTAADTVNLTAENTTRVTAKQTEGVSSLPVGVGAMYVRNEASATVTVADGATIGARQLAVRAHNDATIDAEVAGSKDGTGAIAVGITRGKVSSTARIEHGATLNVSGELSVAATSLTNFKNSTSSTTKEVGGQALGSAAVAISIHDVTTTAELNADVGVGGVTPVDVSVVSLNEAKENTTTAEAKAGEPVQALQLAGKTLEAQTPTDGGAQLQEKLQEKLPEKVPGDKKLDDKIQPTATDSGGKWLTVGGAVAYSHSTYSANATIGDGAQVGATDRLVVAAQTRAEQTGTQAQAEAKSEASKNDPQQPTAKLVVGAGVAIGDYTHNADARVGVGAALTAKQIGIDAQVTLPRKDTPIDKLTDGQWDSWDAVSEKLELVADPAKLVDPFEYANGGASAEGSAENVGLAGAVSLQFYSGNAHAVVDRNAVLKLVDGAATGDWTQTFTMAPADMRTFSFDHVAKLQAAQDAELWFFTGKFGNLAAGKVSLGGAYNLVSSTGSTVALLREGAQVRGSASGAAAASEFGVSAETADRLVGVSAGGGRGESFGLAGQFAMTTLDRNTLAAIDDEATVRAGAVAVHARQDIRSWAVGGAVSTAQTAAVGLGAALNDGRAQVRAAIADVDTELDMASDPTLQVQGEVVTGHLAVDSDARGRLQAVALAGAVAGPSNGPIDWLTERAKSLLGGEDEKGTPEKGKAEKVTESKPESATKDAKTDAAKPKVQFTLAGAGSAAVNLTAIDATAELVGAHVTQTGVADAGLLVRALDSTNVVSAAGAAALTTGGQGKTNVGVAGAVAVNVLSGGALARIAGNSVVTDADAVQVQALKAGEHLSLGVGLNVNAGATQSSWQGTGSVSVTLSTDEVDAEGRSKDRVMAAVDGSTIDFDLGSTARGLEVTAYNKARLGTGAGALNLMGKNAVGGAVTYSELTNTTEARIGAAGAGSTVVDARTVEVKALNAMNIAAGAAMATASAASGGNALSGSVVINKVADDTTAAITASTVSNTGTTKLAESVKVTAKDVSADATLDKLISERSGSIAFDYRAAAARGQAGNGDATANEAARLEADPDANSIVGVAGTLTINPKSSAENASVNYNRIRNTMSATVDDSSIALADGGTLAVNALANSNILGIAVGASLADKFNLSGSVAISEIDNTVTARVSGVNQDATVAARLPLLAIEASDHSRIDTIAGQVSASLGGAAIGAAVGYASIDNTVQAQLDDAAVRGNRSTTVDADSDARIRNIAVAGVGASKFAFAGSVGLNFIDNTTSASVDGSTIAQRDGEVGDVFRVEADDKAKIAALTGALAGAGTGGIGLAFSLNKIGSVEAGDPGHSTRATVTGSEVTGGDAALVRAQSATGIDAIGAALTGGGSFAVSGSFAINHIAAKTSGAVTGGRFDGGDTDLAIDAIDTSRISSHAGGLAVGGTAAVGAAMAFNRIANTVDASLSGLGSSAHRLRELTVTADTLQAIEALTIGAAVGGDLGVGASVAVNLIHDEVGARIDGGAQVVAQNNVGVIADSDEIITNNAGSLGVGAKGAGVGASVSVNRIDGTTEATIDGATTQVSGLGNLRTGDAALTVASGALTADVTMAGGELSDRKAAITDHQRADLDARQQTETVRGVAVNASSTHSIEALGANVAGAPGAGVGAVVNTNVVGGTTTALVDQATVNGAPGGQAVQQASVKASDHTAANGVVGSLAAGASGVGITADVSVFSRETTARVVDAAFDAAGAATIAAQSSQTALSFAVGGAVGGVGLQGTGSVVKFDSLTEAGLSGGTAQVGALEVDARHASRVLQTAGGLAAGGNAAGIGAGVVLDASETRAKLDGATVETAGAVAVDAATRTEVDVLAVAGALSGGIGFAGNAAVVVTHNLTEAQVLSSTIGSAAPGGSAAASLAVHALDSVSVDAKGGAASLAGTLGLAAGASVVKAENTNSAQLVDSTVTTGGATAVTARTERDLAAGAAALGAGPVGLAGTAAVVLSGNSSAEADGQVDGKGGTLAEIDGLLGKATLQNRGGSGDQTVSDRTGSVTMSSTDVTTLNTGSAMAIRDEAVKVAPTSTTALIRGGSVRAGGVQVGAAEANHASASAGAAALGVAGFGAAVGITEIHSTVAARIDRAAQVTAGSDGVTVEAASGDLTDSPAAAALAYQGSGGAIGAGAAIARALNTSTVTAAVLDGADVSTAGATSAVKDGTLRVTARDTSSASATGKGLSVGLVGVGIVVSEARNAGGVDASVAGAGTTSSVDTGQVLVTAWRGTSATATASAGAAGVASGAGALASAVDAGGANAHVDDGAVLDGARGDALDAAGATVTVSATAVPRTEANALGVSVALGAGLGASDATAQSTGAATASVNGATVTARDLVVNASVQVPTASGTHDIPRSALATATSGAGGLLVGVQATNAQALTEAEAHAGIDGSTVLSIGRDASIDSTANSLGLADARGTSAGLVGAGASLATTTSNQQSSALMGTDVTGAVDGRLHVGAAGSDALDAVARAGSGGAVAGSAALATTLDTSKTEATVATANAAAPFTAGRIEVNAAHTGAVDGYVNTLSAGVVGGSGGQLLNQVRTTTTAGFADDAVVRAREIDVNADSTAVKADRVGLNLQAGSGGAIGGAAAQSTTDITLTTTVRVGEDAELIGTGTGTSPGAFRFDAHNSVQAQDDVNLDAGGAIAVAYGVSKITATTTAKVEIARNANVRAEGDLALGASTDGALSTHAYAKTYGLAGTPLADSLATLVARDDVSVAEGATLYSLGETTLSAGSSVDGKPSTLEADARADVFNKTAFPVLAANLTARATVDGRSNIDVAAGAQVNAVTDVNLYADAPHTRAAGVGVGKDLYREIAAAIANAFSWLFGGGHVSLDVRTGSSSASGSGTVNVDGAVRAGAQNKQLLVFNQDGTMNVPAAVRDQVQPKMENLYSNLMALRAGYLAKAQIAVNGSIEQLALQAEVDRITQELLDLKLAQHDTVTQALVPTANVMQSFITVPGLVARGGDVNVRADEFKGTGVVSAPNDTEIRIVNNSAAYLRVNELTIPGNVGGHINVNGVDRHDVSELGPNAHFREFVTGAGTEPLIHVENTYSPPDGGDIRSPDIVVQGDVSNLDGKVDITNATGSIRVQENPRTHVVANIDARDITITAGADVVLGYVDGFRHAGGSPEAQVAALPDPETGSASSYHSDAVADGNGTISGANVYMSARYLNVNGTIRAGQPDWTLDLSDIEPGIQAAQLAWKNGGSNAANAVTVLRVRDNARGRPQVSYNAATDRIEVDGIRVQGGRMVLTGEILNTGGGKLEAMDGYGHIAIDNPTGHAVDLKGLDTGSGAEGQITLIDSGYLVTLDDGSRVPRISVYERLGNGAGQTMTLTHYVFVPDPHGAKRVQVGAAQNLGAGREGTTVQYDPVPGQRYLWVNTELTGQKQTSATAFGGWMFWAGGVTLGNTTVEPIASTSVDTFTPAEGQRGSSQTYGYTYERETNHDWVQEKSDIAGCGFVCNDLFQLKNVTTTATTMVKNIHSIKADNPIPIKFIGYDSGTIAVTSEGDVVLSAGSLRNSSGTTTVSSSAGAIRGEGSRAIVGGVDVTLSARDGIRGASATDALQVEVNGGVLSAVSEAGDVRLHERSGTATYGRLDAAQVLSLGTEGGVEGPGAVLAGQRIEVDAARGVGAVAAVTLERGEGGVAVHAVENISLHHAGDLHADRIESVGGDVTIDIGGQLIDANRNDQRDERTADQLNQVYQRARVTGGAVAESRQLAEDNYRLARERDYFEYWRARGFDAGKPPVAYQASEGETLMFSRNQWKPEQVSAYLAERQALWESFRGTTYDPGYHYVVSQTERDAITRDIAWTPEELAGGLSHALVDKKTTSTETRIEQANLVGRDITVTAGRGVGQLKDPIVITPSTEMTDEKRLALAAAEVDDVAVDNDRGIITVLQRDDVDLQASGTVNVTTAQHAYIGGQANLRLDAVTAGEALRIKGAGSLLSAERGTSGLSAGGNVVLEAAGGSIGSTGAPLQLGLPAGATLTARAQGDIAIAASTAVTLSNVFSAQGTAQLTAAGAIDDVAADTTAAVDAASVVLRGTRIGSVGNALDVATQPGGTIRVEATAGDVRLVDGSETARLAEVRATGAVSLRSAGNIVAGSVRGSDISLESRGEIAAEPGAAGPHLVTTQPDGSVSVRAAGNIGSRDAPMRTQVGRIDAVSATGGVFIDEADDLALAATAAQTVSARVGGDASLGTVVADTLVLDAGGAATIADAQLGSRFELDATQISGHLTQLAGTAGGFTGALGGPAGARAERITVRIDALAPLTLERLYGDIVSLDTSAPQFWLSDGWMRQADIGTPGTRLLIDTLRPQPADVQLYAPNQRYRFSVAGNEVVTDSYVVAKRDSHTTRSPQGRDVTVVDTAARLFVIPKLPQPAGTPVVQERERASPLAVGALRFDVEDDDALPPADASPGAAR